MSARVIRLQTAMTQEQRQAKRDGTPGEFVPLIEEVRRRWCTLLPYAPAALILPFGRPCRRRAKPQPPGGPRPSA